MTIYKEMKYQKRLPGYVSVPKNHPFYGKKYWDIEDKIDRLSLRLQDLSARLDLLVKQVREQQS